ncbi:MAG: diguanylate cyclase [Bacillota bacterium]
MIENTYKANSGCILMDDHGEVLYVSGSCNVEINIFLDKIGAFERIRTGDFGTEMCGTFKVSIERIHVKNQTIYVVEFTDTAHRDRLSRIAYKDLMSGLYNRNMWEHMLKNRCKESCYPFNALVIVDIDNLKEANDRNGHAVGDRMIRVVADSIKESIRSKDIAFRYGGDEFVILLHDVKDNDIHKFMDRIRRKIRKNSKDDEIYVSMGAATFDDLSDLQTAFQEADRHLYEEKQYKKSRTSDERYDELAVLKENIEETRERLNDLVVVEQNHLSEDILDVSRELDDMIYRYLALEADLKSKA